MLQNNIQMLAGKGEKVGSVFKAMRLCPSLQAHLSGEIPGFKFGGAPQAEGF